MGERPLITIVIPVFNEAENIDALYERLSAVIDGLEDRYQFEILFTDNHSDDGTFELVRELSHRDGRVRCLRFSRNFGFQRSILSGYRAARGAAAIQIDADLQDPPELIPEFLSLFEEGYAVVYGIRRRRKEGWLISRTRRFFYWLIDALSPDELPHDAGDFRLVDRRILDSLGEIDDYHPYLRGLIASFGFDQTGVEYDRAERSAGESKFPFRHLVGLATDGILLHSVIPLRIATLVAFVMAIAMLIGIGFYLFANVVLDAELPAGFTSLAVLIMVGIVLNALFLGVVGEYLGRMYQQVKRRPITIVESVLPEPTTHDTDGQGSSDGSWTSG